VSQPGQTEATFTLAALEKAAAKLAAAAMQAAGMGPGSLERKFSLPSENGALQQRGASEQAVTEACRAEGPGAGPELAGGTCRTHWRSVVRQEFACARLLRQRTGKQTFVNCLLLLITGSCTKRVLAIPRRIYYAAMCVIARTKYHAS
jgi:hypothetical protein